MVCVFVSTLVNSLSFKDQSIALHVAVALSKAIALWVWKTIEKYEQVEVQTGKLRIHL
jgi:hypothetical protein